MRNKVWHGTKKEFEERPFAVVDKADVVVISGVGYDFRLMRRSMSRRSADECVERMRGALVVWGKGDEVVL